jgi:transposase
MLEAIVKRSAGLDVHKKEIVATVLKEEADGQLSEMTRAFGTLKQDYKSLADWLVDEAVECVAMESTGIYWKRPYTELEAAGLKVLVVNARHVKQLPGRKTDIKDSQWLASLARLGLLKGSFIPEKDFRELRTVTRYRYKLTGMIASEKNRLHKLLDDAGIRLGNVVSDINGATAKRIIEGLIQKEDIETLLSYTRGSILKNKKQALRAVLNDELSERHRFVLKNIQHHIDQMNTELQDLDNYIAQALKPYQKQWQLLQTIPGIDAISAACLLVELGVDMEHFKSSQQLCSWAGMCPGNNESAGKKASGRTRKGNQQIRKILCEVAHATSRTKSQFKGQYQGIMIRRGKKRAIIAVGHKLLRVVYCLLKNGKPYRDPNIDYEALVVQRNAPRWIQALQKFGYVNYAT